MALLRRVALRFASPLLLLAVAACSILVDESAKQCSTTADCQARGAAFAGSYCEASACRASCTTNQQCTGENANDPWICRADHTCARLFSEDCTTLLADPGDPSDAKVLWLGMLLPRDVATRTLSRAKEDAAELARRDFDLTSGGLPPLVSGGPRRRFAFIVCDDTADVDRAARHLIDDLKVPGILGPVYSDTLIKVATDVTIPRGTLLVTPSATSTYITDLPGKNDLVWRTCASDAEQAVAMSQLIQSVLEPQLRASVLSSGEPLKVANVHKGDAYGLGLGGAIARDLVVNGASTGDNAARGDYIAFDYGDPSSPTDTQPSALYKAAVDKVLALAPHVVILSGTQEAITDILAPIEARWPSGLLYRPRYVLGDGAYPRPELLQQVGANGELRARVLGTAPGSASPLYAQFLQRYASVFPDGTEAVLSTAATYDAAYLLAYAISAIGDAPVTGANLVAGLKKMVGPGPAITVGTDAINQALNVLAVGQPIDIVGTSGPLDFDVATGDTHGDIQVWCLGTDANGNASRFQNSGLFLAASTLMLQGRLVCP